MSIRNPYKSRFLEQFGNEIGFAFVLGEFGEVLDEMGISMTKTNWPRRRWLEPSKRGIVDSIEDLELNKSLFNNLIELAI